MSHYSQPRRRAAVAVALTQSRPLPLLFATILAILGLMAAVFPSSALSLDSENVRMAKAMSNAFAEVVEHVAPAVVGIETEKVVPVSRPSLGDDFNPFEGFERFFGPDFGPRFRTPPRRRPDSGSEAPSTRRRASLGSGVIIDKEGHILTNNHVVADADAIKVELASDKSKTYKAEIVGRDPNSDLAVIKLVDPPADLPVAELGDSDALQPGNIVIAIGSPLGFKQSVSQGIVSAKGRTLGELLYERFIQTDAAINQGNSGGPLVNLDGQVVGLNTMISTAGGFGGGSIGIGFAIPINQAKSVITQLIEKGSVTRGWIGIVMNKEIPDISLDMGHDGTGVLVSDLDPNGPGVKAGLEPGDLIISFDNVPIRDNEHLRYMVADTVPERDVPLVVLRNGEKLNLTINIAIRPDDLEARYRSGDGGSRGSGGEEPDEVASSLGISVGNLTDTLRQKYGISDSVTAGVVITKVDEGSQAQEQNIRPGAVIIEMDKKPVADVAGFRKILKDSADGEDGVKKSNILLRVRSGEIVTYVLLKLQ